MEAAYIEITGDLNGPVRLYVRNIGAIVSYNEGKSCRVHLPGGVLTFLHIPYQRMCELYEQATSINSSK